MARPFNRPPSTEGLPESPMLRLLARASVEDAEAPSPPKNGERAAALQEAAEEAQLLESLAYAGFQKRETLMGEEWVSPEMADGVRLKLLLSRLMGRRLIKIALYQKKEGSTGKTLKEWPCEPLAKACEVILKNYANFGRKKSENCETGGV